MKKIFISHPYIGNIEQNRKEVDKICKYALKQGYLPLSPLHMFSFMADDAGRDDIMAICYRLIDISDEVWVFGDSKGCRQERKYAKKKNKRIRLFYSDSNIDFKRMMENNREVML